MLKIILTRVKIHEWIYKFLVTYKSFPASWTIKLIIKCVYVYVCVFVYATRTHRNYVILIKDHWLQIYYLRHNFINSECILKCKLKKNFERKNTLATSLRLSIDQV